jgi:hypothetical protein
LKETREEAAKEVPEAPGAAPEPQETVSQEPSPNAAQSSAAITVMEELLRNSKVKPHWPMYLRTFKQFLRSLQPPFDERQNGFSSTYELARQAHRDGLLRVERNRQGILRIYPGERFPRAMPEQPAEGQTQTAESGAPSSEHMTLGKEPETALQLDRPESYMHLQAGKAEFAVESPQESEANASVQAEPIEIIEEIAEGPAPKTKPRRTRKPAGARTAKSPRKPKSKASAN